MRSVVHVRLFSPFDRLCGKSRVTAEFSTTPCLADVLARLVEEHPALGSYLGQRTGHGRTDFEDYFLACVGITILRPEDVLADGAEVTLFAPHAGG